MAESRKILENYWQIAFYCTCSILSLDTVSRQGQDVGVRTAYRPQEVNDGRHDSGELQQGRRVDAEAAAGDTADLDDAMVAVRDSVVWASVDGDIDLGKRDAGSGMARAVEHGPEEVGRGYRRCAEEAPGDAR